MGRDFNKDLRKVRGIIDEDRTQFVLFVGERYKDLLKEMFMKFYENSGDEKKEKIKSLLGETSIKKIGLGLGSWIGIYRKLNLFDVFGSKDVNPKVIDGINTVRNLKAHPEEIEKLKKSEVSDIYFKFVKALRNFNYEIDPIAHGLCEYCLNEWAREKRDGKLIGKRCKAKILIFEEYAQELEDIIISRIYNLLRTFRPEIPKLEESLQKGLKHPNEILKEQEFYHEGLCLEELNEDQIE